ncbi:MAG: hypothetical protein N3D75_03065 [Candidatus Aenigmarchaeota archaeon]|nr:hypothetical protein [Candidatus Aenigmarchaeota archaeon]
MKGEAENTIVRIVIALIIIGVVVALIYLSLGPFRREINYNICYAALKSYCAGSSTDKFADVKTNSCDNREMSTEKKAFIDSLANCDDVNKN